MLPLHFIEIRNQNKTDHIVQHIVQRREYTANIL